MDDDHTPFLTSQQVLLARRYYNYPKLNIILEKQISKPITGRANNINSTHTKNNINYDSMRINSSKYLKLISQRSNYKKNMFS